MGREILMAGLLVLFAACVAATGGDALTDFKNVAPGRERIFEGKREISRVQGPFLLSSSETTTCASSGLAFCNIQVANYLSNLAFVFLNISVSNGQIYTGTAAPCNFQRYFGGLPLGTVFGTVTNQGGTTSYSPVNAQCGTNKLCCGCNCDPTLGPNNCTTFFGQILTVPYDQAATVRIVYSLTTADQVSWPGEVTCQPTLIPTTAVPPTTLPPTTVPPTTAAPTTVPPTTVPPTTAAPTTVPPTTVPPTTVPPTTVPPTTVPPTTVPPTTVPPTTVPPTTVPPTTVPPTTTARPTTVAPTTAAPTTTVTFTTPVPTTSACQSVLYGQCNPNVSTPCCNANWRCARHQHAPGCGSPIEQFLCIPNSLVSFP